MRRALRLASLALLFSLLRIEAAHGQDLADLALDWARGEYRGPLICAIDGTHHVALRRLLIRPKPGHRGAPLNQILLFDLEAPPGVSCTNAAGGAALNVSGRLEITLDAPARPDLAKHEFESALRRERGFEFLVRSGELSVSPLNSKQPAKRVDLRGGHARLRLIEPGSDAERRLRDFRGPRQLLLELRAPAGDELAFELVQVDER